MKGESSQVQKEGTNRRAWLWMMPDRPMRGPSLARGCGGQIRVAAIWYSWQHRGWSLWQLICASRLLPAVRSNAFHPEMPHPQPVACFLPGQRANAITSVTNLHGWELRLRTETFIQDSGLQGAGSLDRKSDPASICCLQKGMPANVFRENKLN